MLHLYHYYWRASFFQSVLSNKNNKNTHLRSHLKPLECIDVYIFEGKSCVGVLFAISQSFVSGLVFLFLYIDFWKQQKSFCKWKGEKQREQKYEKTTHIITSTFFLFWNIEHCRPIMTWLHAKRIGIEMNDYHVCVFVCECLMACDTPHTDRGFIVQVSFVFIFFCVWGDFFLRM